MAKARKQKLLSEIGTVTGPRELKDPRSREFAIQTVRNLGRLLESKDITEQRVRDELELIDQYHHWKVLGYQDENELLVKEIGLDHEALIHRGQSLRKSSLDDIGDPNAEPGSIGWAKRTLFEMRTDLTKLDGEVGILQHALNAMDKYKAWKLLGYCSLETMGQMELHLAPDVIHKIRKAKRGERLGAVLSQQLAADESVKPLAAHGEVGRGRNRVDNIKSNQGGTNAEYLVRRLKRDAPDIAAALGRGEYKSARSAAIAAGIITPPTVVELLQRYWCKATAKQCKEFLEWTRKRS